MKKPTENTNVKSLVTAIAALGLIVPFVPFVQADDRTANKAEGARDRNAPKAEGARDRNAPQAEGARDRNANKAEGTRESLKPEVTATFVDGYTVPDQYQTYFTEVPEIQEENVVVRYRNGRAYYVNSDDWKIVRVVELDSSVKLTSEESAFVKGYVVPEQHRTRFAEVPRPDAGLSVRYYNNTAYYMDPSYRIVRTVRLNP